MAHLVEYGQLRREMAKVIATEEGMAIKIDAMSIIAQFTLHDNTEKIYKLRWIGKREEYLFLKLAVSFYWEALIKSQVLFKG